MPDTIYRRNLPHIQPQGYPLFITFRLTDSLPMAILLKLKEEREAELKSSSNRACTDVYEIEERHFGRYDDWLDRNTTGPRWLEDKNIAGIVSRKILEMHDDLNKLVAYCIMSNHV